MFFTVIVHKIKYTKDVFAAARSTLACLCRHFGLAFDV